MKCKTILLMAFFAMLFACTEDVIQEVYTDSTAEDGLVAEKILSPLSDYSAKAFISDLESELELKCRGAVKKKLKIKRSTGTISFIPDSPDCDGFIKVLIEGEGIASILGKFTIELSYCSDGVNPLGPILGTQTAANGDQLFTALVGGGTDPVLGDYQEYIYYGGTGRFVDAAGEITLYGTVDYQNLVFNLSGEGWLVLKKAHYPDELSLPVGFQPEGIVIGERNTFFVGSAVYGTIYKGNLRTGKGEVFINPLELGLPPAQAVGLSLDKRSGYLYVAGGFSIEPPFIGKIHVYNYRNGTHVRTFEIPSPGPVFINDVILTQKAAYFTDSFNAVLYKIPLRKNGRLTNSSEVVHLPLDGFSMAAVGLPGFPVPIFANGIEADPSGHKLIVANMDRGELYSVNPYNGSAKLIDLGGDLVPYADGILLDGRTLYVVQNVLNQIAVIRLDSKLKSGRIVNVITDDLLGIPSTIDDFGNYLYAVNAHFDLAPPPGIFPEVSFEVVKLKKK